jgi:hypothetical protein
MRRLRILVVGSLAAASVTAWAGPAHAARGSDFCDQAGDLLDDIGNFDPLDSSGSEEFEDQVDAAIDAYQELEENAPKKLKKAFRVNRRYYELFEDGGIDVTDPEQLQDIAERTGKLIRANTRIYNYLAEECGNVPDISVPEISVPEISVPEISVPDISIPGRDGN